MLRPSVYVAVAPGWPAALLRVGMVLATGLMLVPVLLARMPEDWSEALGDGSTPLRLLGVGLLLWSMAWLHALLETRLPHSVYAFRDSLVYREHSRRRRVSLAQVHELFVELRPAPDGEVAVIEFADGSLRELCPLRWRGAGALYRHVRRKIDRRARAKARARRRAGARSRSGAGDDVHPSSSASL